MKISTIVFSSACCGSLVLGYWIGQKQTSDAPAPALEAQIDAPKKAEPSVRTQTVSSAAATGYDNIELTEALEVANQLSPDQLREQLASAFALPKTDPTRQRSIRTLLNELAETHPLEALELAGSIDSLRVSEEAKTSILETWAEHDPIAALAWAEANLANVPGRLRESQLTAIFRGYARLNPQAAFNAALQLDDSSAQAADLRRRALSEVVEAQIRNGELYTAKQTIEQLPEGDTKNRLMREMVDEWASYDPENAATYVLSLGDAATSNMKTSLAEEWAENDPAAAAAWLSSLPADDPALGRATAEIIREWSRYDLTASAEWLNSLPASPDLDWAVASYTYRAAQEDPASAISWAESISNDRMRERMTQQVAANWKQQDPDSFQDYLDSNDFTDEQKEELNNARAWDGRGGRGGPGGGGGGGGGRGDRGGR